MSQERTSLAGTHRARAREWDLDVQNGKECVVVRFELVGGDHDGKSIQWWGYFTEKTVDRTLDSLRHCGWASDSLAELDGLDANEVELVIDDEEYEGKWRSKVKWVNRPSKLFTKAPMNAQERAAFAARLRGKTTAHRQKYGTQPTPSAAPKSAPANNRTYSQHSDPEPGAADFDDIPF